MIDIKRTVGEIKGELFNKENEGNEELNKKNVNANNENQLRNYNDEVGSHSFEGGNYLNEKFQPSENNESRKISEQNSRDTSKNQENIANNNEGKKEKMEKIVLVLSI